MVISSCRRVTVDLQNVGVKRDKNSCILTRGTPAGVAGIRFALTVRVWNADRITQCSLYSLGRVKAEDIPMALNQLLPSHAGAILWLLLTFG
jgi:hypothetical protein